MKLTTRKKIILLGAILLFLLISLAVVVLNSKEKGISSIPHENELSLKQSQTQAVSEVQSLLSSKNIETADLLTKLKGQQILKSNETDWKIAFNRVNNLNELNTLKKNVLAVVNDLPNTPSPHPTPQPENRWEKILREIREFINTSPKSFQEVKDWLETQNYPEPLAGIDLKGAGADKLKELPSTPAPSDFATCPDTENYQGWVRLSALGDGNCFLHSFSVLLVGQSEVDLTFRLRVAICLELMKNPGKYFGWGEDAILRNLKDKIINEDFTLNNKELEGTHIEYLAHIFKRPLVVISKIPESYRVNLGQNFEVLEYPNHNVYGQSSAFFTPENSREPWVIYNSGGHFQPLIKK